MAKWTFEPGHTAAEFCVRHMMVTWVRGHLKNIHGTIEFDPENPGSSSVEVSINTGELWSGDTNRDSSLRGSDFLDVENHPMITFKGNANELIGKNEFRVTGDLIIRGVSQRVTLEVNYIGQWETPFWVDGEDKGPKTRAGFVGKTTIDRNDFGMTWNGEMEKGGVVVGKDVLITIDVEALREDER